MNNLPDGYYRVIMLWTERTRQPIYHGQHMHFVLLDTGERSNIFMSDKMLVGLGMKRKGRMGEFIYEMTEDHEQPVCILHIKKGWAAHVRITNEKVACDIRRREDDLPIEEF